MDPIKIKHFLLVLSGKGGVGKSTVTVQLALQLVKQGFRVGVLDVDLCGPSIPYLLGVEGKSVISNSHGHWVPVVPDHDDFQHLHIMSLGLLLQNRDDAVAWRGPKKTAMIKSFLDSVHWPMVDYLVIDTPPGTSDEHISVVEYIFQKYGTDCSSSLIVTTPQVCEPKGTQLTYQGVSVVDVQKEITFCKTIGLKIDGLIENMSGYVCPNCEECTNIFGSGGGKSLSEIQQIPYLGKLPIDPRLNSYLSEKKSICDSFDPNAISVRALQAYAQSLKAQQKS